jgi:TM2 domain-containing membrane protein YozV
LIDQSEPSFIKMPVAGILSWIVPGLGHIYLGHRRRGLILLVTITATFWSGVAIGSVQGTVDPTERKLWFFAQIGTGANAISAVILNRITTREDRANNRKPVVTNWVAAEVGVHYTGVAGLLNILVIFDAVSRADPSRLRRSRASPSGGFS